MIPALELRDAITVITGLVTITAVIVSLRAGVMKLDLGLVEITRQVSALHKRLDSVSERVNRQERNHAVLEERVANLRTSQRFRVPEEPPMFKDEDR